MEATNFMPGEDNSTDDKSDVEETKNHDALDDVLNDSADDKDKDKDKDGADNDDKNKNKKDDGADDKDADKPFNKKIGTQEFKSEEAYDEAIASMQSRNQSMAEHLGKHGIDPKTGEKKEVNDEDDKDENKEDDKKPDEKKDEDTEEKQYYRFKGMEFQKEFPDSKNYTEEMQVLLKRGKVNLGDNNEPSFALAYAKSLRADGKDIPDKIMRIIQIQKGENPDDESRSAQKKIMRSGAGGDSGNTSGQDTFQSKEELDEASDFANKVALGKD